MSKTRATILGSMAILMWSLLALLTVKTAPVPAFQLTALTFAIGAFVGALWLYTSGDLMNFRQINWKVYAFGTCGLFGYHFFYFTALRLAPAAEAGLIAYLWPLLIVLLSGFLPGERLRFGHIVGALIGFLGAALIILQNGVNFDSDAAIGYIVALICALFWSVYSVLSRRLGETPTTSVVIFCIATAFLSWIAHLALEDTKWPENYVGWLSIVGLGLGPVGLAFFVWDIGMKKGDIQLLGVASYAAPLLSTFALVVMGIAPLTWVLGLATILISFGAIIAARAGLRSS